MFGLSSQFELTRPSWLFGLALVPLVAWYFRKSLVDFPRLQRLLSLTARSIIVALLVLSLSGLTWMTRTIVCMSLQRLKNTKGGSRRGTP